MASPLKQEGLHEERRRKEHRFAAAGKAPDLCAVAWKSRVIYQRREMSLEGTALLPALLSKLALGGTIVFSLNFRDL